MPCFGLLAMSALGWFQSRDGYIRLHASTPALNGFLRFTSGVTPTDLMVARKVAKPYLIHILAYIQALVGLESGIEHATA